MNWKKEKEYYEIRLESIGGLGANLCGKMLGELGLKYLDLNSSSFSSYGSEKTGTPVKGYVRYCRKEKEIRVHFPVVKPDLLVIFHEALIKDESVWKGCHKDTIVILAVDSVNDSQRETPEAALKWLLASSFKEDQEIPEKVYLLEAQQIAMETHSRINVVMLGAALKVMGVMDIEVGNQICKDTLGKKYPDALQNNLQGIKRGFEEVRLVTSKGKGALIARKEKEGDGPKKESWGYDTAPIGGINPNFGSTVLSDVSPSRQGFIPLFIKEKCINCGLCHSTCPDMVFQFKKGEYKGKEMMVNEGLDYYHCKGCLRCVDVCPVNALVRAVESEYPDKPYYMANQDLLYRPEHYEKAGPDGYITSESYLTEQRMEGGEV
ncbi:MAG: 2-oxoacid:acceptor oxidoreductase family protein [Lachnospiraceae bacterium]|nr:2-oxoacid:acceptor oxidoreductase family protein [Lachnospiraceae bacterium]